MDKNVIKTILLTSPFYYNLFCKNSEEDSKGKRKCSNSSKKSAIESSGEESTDAESDNEDNKKEDDPEKKKDPKKNPKKTKKEIYIEKTKELRNKFEEYKKIINDKTSDEVSNSVSNHLCGFNNYGNTCYFNAAMQNLTHNKELVKTILDYAKATNKESINEEIIAFHYLIVKIYEQEKEREKDNNEKVIYNELNDLRYFFAFKGILDEYNFYNRENFFTSLQQDSQELLNKLIDDIKTILNDKLKIFDIYDDERVKCNNNTHKGDQRDQIGTIKQYKFEENIKTNDPKTYKSIKEFLNNPIVETLGENGGSDCFECIREELKRNDKKFDTNIENEYKKISDCSKCKTIYGGISDDKKPKNGNYTSIDGNTIQHCEICDKIYNSKCDTCKKIHQNMCEEKSKNCVKKQRKNKTIKLKSVNDYLIIHLARFKDTKNKINDEIEFEENLNFNEKNEKFDLVGIICQSGSLDSGHYYSYNKIGDKWYEFNDSKVSPVQDNNILNVANIKSQNYVLFYKKQ